MRLNVFFPWTSARTTKPEFLFNIRVDSIAFQRRRTPVSPRRSRESLASLFRAHKYGLDNTMTFFLSLLALAPQASIGDGKKTCSIPARRTRLRTAAAPKKCDTPKSMAATKVDVTKSRSTLVELCLAPDGKIPLR